MTSKDWKPHFIDRPVDHARDCANVLKNKDQCNCYLSWNRDTIAPTSTFGAATNEAPEGVYGTLDEQDRAAIQNFVDLKNSQNDERLKGQYSHTGIYSALAHGEIRVLELHRGVLGSPLEGRLHIVSVDFAYPTQSLDNATQSYTRQTNHALSSMSGKPVWYTALSYVWGTPIFDQTILVGDTSIAITRSLAAALRSLRSTEISIFLWIDQICINQPNTREKEQQIPLMGLIYTHATNTLIWLGDEDGQEPLLALDTMEYIHSRLQMSDAEITPSDFDRLDFPPPDHRSWRAIRLLLQRPWFSRLWTIQEAVLSRNLFVKCGEAVASWDDLAAWCYVLEHSKLLQWLSTTDTSECKPTDGTCYGRRSPLGGATIDSLQSARLHNLTMVEQEYLLNSLVRTRYAQATDAKDKVYGVLGISESNIVPDYSAATTARDIYEEACLTQIPGLIYELLSCVDHDTPLKPSWVPDWSTDRVTEALGYSTKAWTLYHAGSKAIGELIISTPHPTTVDLSGDKKRITLSGLVFDTIVLLGDVNEQATLDIDEPQHGNASLVSCVQLVRERYTPEEYPAPNISIYDAFWQTLVAGRDGSGIACPTEEHSDVFSLILDSTTGKMPSLPGQKYNSRRQKGFFTLASLQTRRPAKTLEDLRTAIRAALTMRRFAVTQRGYFALVPRGAREGDEIVVFEKACVPFVVREAYYDNGTCQGYELLGETYVHGIMKGEAMNMPDSHLEDVTLL
ncbi:heterokaryon incompatibility protein-domain-containing protein [Phaeosphaeria sp. MPI-PUGE-AT-0046c]|nr:heterokaryon incompatibility protein-domain-containing protein [Phaeosphaeria sp. MPI-PUGE-AT-0046c]